MPKLTYSQYQAIIRRRAWQKFTKEWEVKGTVFSLAVSVVIAVISWTIFGAVEAVITALLTLGFLFLASLVFYLGFFHREHVSTYNQNANTIKDLEEKLYAVTPNIQLQDEISIRDVWMAYDFNLPPPRSCLVSLPFANNPKFPDQYNSVANARAEITFLDESNTPLFKPITGRWGGLQPPEIFGSDKRVLESTDFPNNGAVRWLDLSLKYPEDEYCYAYNNDSYTFAKQYYQHPELQISSKRFYVQVRLKGTHIPEDVWELEVITKGKGDTLQIRRAGEEWQPKVKSQATKNLPQTTAKKTTSRKRAS
jgi:hypothetical protein